MHQWKEVVSKLNSVPTDLAIVASYALVAVIVVEFVPASPPLSAIVAMPLLLFVPGYTLVAAIYPGRNEDTNRIGLRHAVNARRFDGGIHVLERIALSFGMSVALIPLIGGGVWAVFQEVSRSIVLLGLVTFTLAMAFIAAIRRFSIAADARFRVQPSTGTRRFQQWMEGNSAGEMGANLLLVGGILVALMTLTYAFTVPTTGNAFSTATLLTEQDGEYMTSGYPSTFTAGEPQSLTLELTSNEHVKTEYTVFVTVERVQEQGTETVVLEQSMLDQLDLTLEPGETVRHEHDVAPEMTGQNLRLSYYVYKGAAPETPSASSAYRHPYIWIDVAESS